MHPLFKKASELTKVIIGAAIEVHRDKGPGTEDEIFLGETLFPPFAL